jgi:hypothetical protein
MLLCSCTQMEQANEQWQQYAEQRDQYARVLAQRCGELEMALNSRRPSSDSQMSEEQLRKIDRLLLDQRQKMQLMDEAKNQVVATSYVIVNCYVN